MMVSDSQLDLSVVIATHNRRSLLARCLEGLGEQTLDGARFEVVVADDGSSDGTAEMAEAFEAPFAVRVLRLGKSGQPTAQNAALREARGRVCLILDDDTIPAPGLLAEHLAAHGNGDALGIGKLIQVPPDARDWYARAFTRGWNEHYDDLAERPARWSDCYGANFSAPRHAFVESGGFAADLPTAQDLEIGFRLSQAGCEPTYLDRARAMLDDQKRWRQMLADAQRQGVGHIEFARRHPSTLGDVLDWNADAGAIELALRRVLIAVRLPAAILVKLGWLLPGSGRKMIWFHFVRRFVFWQSVNRNVGRAKWRELVGPMRTEGVSGPSR